MFRFNNPDAALVLLLVVGAYAHGPRARAGSTWWLVLAFSMVGFGFLAKMLQALLVLPGVRARVPGRGAGLDVEARLAADRSACGALLVSAGWWVAIVELWPASRRPYIGGSQHNSILEPDLRLQRLRSPHRQRDRQRRRRWRQTGRVGPDRITRMFSAEFGTQISWLLPAALILLVAGLVWRGTRPRTDRVRAAFVLWGGWLLVTGPRSASARASSTSTTRSPSRPRSARSSAWARACCGSAGTTSPRARCSRWSSRSPRSGRSCCSTARPTGTRGCAVRC